MEDKFEYGSVRDSSKVLSTGEVTFRSQSDDHVEAVKSYLSEMSEIAQSHRRVIQELAPELGLDPDDTEFYYRTDLAGGESPVGFIGYPEVNPSDGSGLRLGLDSQDGQVCLVWFPDPLVENGRSIARKLSELYVPPIDMLKLGIQHPTPRLVDHMDGTSEWCLPEVIIAFDEINEHVYAAWFTGVSNFNYESLQSYALALMGLHEDDTGTGWEEVVLRVDRAHAAIQALSESTTHLHCSPEQ